MLYGDISRAQKLLLPAHKLLDVVDQPQEGRGRLLVGQVCYDAVEGW
jgi:hypothetical protein